MRSVLIAPPPDPRSCRVAFETCTFVSTTLSRLGPAVLTAALKHNGTLTATKQTSRKHPSMSRTTTTTFQPPNEEMETKELTLKLPRPKLPLHPAPLLLRPQRPRPLHPIMPRIALADPARHNAIILEHRLERRRVIPRRAADEAEA